MTAHSNPKELLDASLFTVKLPFQNLIRPGKAGAKNSMPQSAAGITNTASSNAQQQQQPEHAVSL
jgi:hypothetical protein